MASDLIIGLDPGLSGAMAVVGAIPWRVHVLLPWDFRSKRGQRSSLAHYSRKFTETLAEVQPWFKPLPGLGPPVVVTEATGSRPGQGIASTHRFGMATGIVEGWIMGQDCRATIVKVSPAKWKRHLGLDGDKGKSIELAECWYPHRKWLKKDHNLAEALLLVVWYALAEAHRELDPKHGGKWGILQ